MKKDKSEKFFRDFLPLILIVIIPIIIWLVMSNLVESKKVSAELADEQDINYKFDQILEKKLSVNYLIIGDSIGQSDGASSISTKWYTMFEDKLKKISGVGSFGELITTPGGTVFSGITNYDKINITPDLVIICFGQNDQNKITNEKFGSIYEELIIRLKTDYPNALIVTLTENGVSSTDTIDTISLLSKHYNLENINMKNEFAKTGIPYNSLTNDGIHPNDAGYREYANRIYNVVAKYKSAANESSSNRRLFPESELYTNLKFNNKFETSSFELTDYGSLYTSKVNERLTINFEGNIFGLSHQGHPSGGIYDIYIDGEFYQSIDTFVPFNVTHNNIIADKLKDGKHTAELIIREVPNSGNVTINSYYTNR